LPSLDQLRALGNPITIDEWKRMHPSWPGIDAAAARPAGAPPVRLASARIGPDREVQELDRPKPERSQQPHCIANRLPAASIGSDAIRVMIC